MPFIHNIETKIAGWLKQVPHMPREAQRWLAANAWWVVLIGAIISGISLIAYLLSLGTAVSYLTSNAPFVSYYIVPLYTGWTVVSLVVSLVFTLVIGLLLAAAVKPLKTLDKKGWDLLYFVLLAQAASLVVSLLISILSLNILGFFIGAIFGLISLAIAAYLLFEIRGSFIPRARIVKK